MLTTTVGAYPKPDSVAIETWFGARARRPSEGYDTALEVMGEEAEGLLDEAVREVVREQVEAGDPGRESGRESAALPAGMLVDRSESGEGFSAPGRGAKPAFERTSPRP